MPFSNLIKAKNRVWIVLIFIWAALCFRFLFFDQYLATTLGGDSPAHAAFNYYYCQTPMAWTNTHLSQFYHPFGVDLRLSYDQPFLNLITCPVAEIWGPVAQFNFYVALQILLIFVISFLFIKDRVQSQALQISFVFLTAFSSFAMYRILGQPNLLSMIWGFLLVLLLFLNVDLTQRRALIGRFLILGICLASAWQNGPHLFPLFLVLMLRQILLQKLDRQKVFNLVMASLCMILFLIPFVGPMVVAMATLNPNRDFASQHHYYADLLSYWTPVYFNWPHQWLYGWLGYDVVPKEVGYVERVVGIDWMTLLLSPLLIYLGLKKTEKPENRLFILLIGIYFVLSLGPKVSFGNKIFFELPYFDFLMKVPPFSLTRNPARYASAVGILLTYLMIFRIDQLKFRFGPLKQIMALGFLTWAVFWTGLYNFNFRIPVLNYGGGKLSEVIRVIKNDPDPNALMLYLPFSTNPNQIMDFIGLISGKSQVTGYVSYTLMTDELLEKIHSYYGDMVRLACNLGPENDAILDEASKNMDVFVNYFRERKIRYLVVGDVPLEQCGGFQRWEQKLQLHPKVELFENFMFRFYRIN